MPRHAQTQLVGSVRTQAELRVPHVFRARLCPDCRGARHEPALAVRSGPFEARSDDKLAQKGTLSEGVSKGVWKWVNE